MANRVDEYGRAYAGSQLQIQIYVNQRAEELSRAIFSALPSQDSLPTNFRCVSPIKDDDFREYRDCAFLKALGLEEHCDTLKQFWPRGGPCWDALAVVEFADSSKPDGVILVEAKSYPEEIYGPGCQAKSPTSIRKIKDALNDTKRWLGVPDGKDWTGSLYQSANRLAHLYFLREVANTPAWLVNVHFLNDPHRSTTREQWCAALPQIKQEIGINEVGHFYLADVFLEARPRNELLRIPNKMNQTYVIPKKRPPLSLL